MKGKKDRELALNGGEMSIGRGTDCTLMVNDPMVSSHHLTIFEKNGAAYVRDENSVNGTFLNGAPLSDVVPLHHKSEISFCNYKIVVFMDQPEPPGGRAVPDESGGKKTMMISREDIAAVRKSGLPFSKKQMILGGVAGLAILVLLVLMMLPAAESGKKAPPSLKGGMLDTYFLKLGQEVRTKIDDKQDLEQAQSFYRLGVEKLKMKKVNYDATFTALLYFYRAKGSMMEINPKPALWDELNPKIAETEQNLKKKLKELFQQAWLAENDKNKDEAIRIYQTIQAMIPDQSSVIYRTAGFRMAKLR